jgi:formylglycine-generating enzyme required for sulfatase activity
MMGSNEHDNEKPVHRVTIRAPFAVGRFAVTFEEWDAAGLAHKPSEEGWGRGRRPVINVSWDDAKDYVRWLSQQTGREYRLLSEAEWEYAARAGTTTQYAFGDTITKSQAQFSANRTAEVGSFPANRFGLHDMHGNVWEWVEDSKYPNYRGAPTDGSVRRGGDKLVEFFRARRGGSWLCWHRPEYLSSAHRHGGRRTYRDRSLGFRVARTL